MSQPKKSAELSPELSPKLPELSPKGGTDQADGAASATAPQAPQVWAPVAGADGPGRAEPTAGTPASLNGAQGPAQAAHWAPATATPAEVERRARIVAAIAKSQARPPKRAWGRR